MNQELKYKRILLKLSGESLGGVEGKGINEKVMAEYAEEIAQVCRMGVQVAIVIGGGNIFRGLSGVGKGFDRVRGDQMGMLATVINSIGLSMAIKSAGIDAEVFTSTPMKPIAEYYVRDKAVELLAIVVVLCMENARLVPLRLPFAFYRFHIHSVVNLHSNGEIAKFIISI